MSKPVILTGLRANNDLHLGSYLGAILPMVQLQAKYGKDYQLNMFIPDLHSFTTPIDHSQLFEQSIHNLKLFVAAGLDINHPGTYIYRQSFVPAHSELTIILNCFTYIGELRRMTQFKEKTKSHQTSVQKDIEDLVIAEGKPEATPVKGSIHIQAGGTLLPVGETVSVGLFDYPVLMAADILLYGAKYVPVGDDQTQHVELARDIAIRMNNKFGENLLYPPEEEKEQVKFAGNQERLRIRDLTDPSKKMSKSDETGKGVLFLGDEPSVAAKKILSATTDSLANIKYDHKEQPGISNLMDILAALSDQSIDEVRKKYEGKTQYGPLKEETAKAVSSFLTDFQAKLKQVDDGGLMKKLEESEKAMNIVANETLTRVQKAVGLRQ